MRILATVTQNYYGRPGALDLMHLAFTLPLRKLGHHVDCFDHVKLCKQKGPEACGEDFARAVRRGYDLVLYQTGGGEFMVREAIRDAAAIAPVIAWNSDDDWQWDSISKFQAPFFTYMVTTYPHIYEMNRAEFPNLRLSQWGALDLYADHTRARDLDFAFVGQVYGMRVQELRALRKRMDLKIFGLGSIRVWCKPMNHRGIRKVVTRLAPWIDRPLDFQQVNDIWNRTRVSFTPMSSSVNPRLLQIKSRAFEMGLSGTLMLSQLSPNLAKYYEPGKEFVAFNGLEDCVEKATYYINHEAERAKIAEAYRRRTLGEHMWEHRWTKLFEETGVASRRAA